MLCPKLSFPCLISTNFIEMSLKGHPGHTLFSMLVWGVNKFCLKRSNFVQKWPNFEIFEKTYSPHLNGHSPHVASGEWVGQRCSRAGKQNIRPTGQMWPAEAIFGPPAKPKITSIQLVCLIKHPQKYRFWPLDILPNFFWPTWDLSCASLL